MSSNAPRPDWAAAQTKLIEEVRTQGKPQTGFFAGKDILLLETTGAKTGAERIAPVAFTRDGERLVVVASKGGAGPIRPGSPTSSRTHLSRSRRAARSFRPGPFP